ncbi:ABC transporter ATP-binding protein [Glutamicibacter uratoxydans]|uniref:ABC transporter ATP-binding protein n=1 Tax=Glutamicibacter uratoxydans TaxID=43667 RepID=A0A4Y4DQI4_GLUUR|nr:ATP-binding cassette domain-containing protein [Glutamicibacter uratoxydans]GED07612.1 ABC transporter ATP-binding protein [Glutamicibacter uratoxydans]
MDSPQLNKVFINKEEQHEEVTMNGLQLNGVSRSFGNHTVLHSMDLGVQPGEIVGFIGGNGAGKTTTMRLILGLLAADTGEITWDGRPITSADRRKIGYMPEERGLYPQMPIREQIIHFALLEGNSTKAARGIADDLIASLGLQGREKTLVQDLSLGNQQRVQLAVALVGNPNLLVLDEPFSGLDPTAVATMGSLLQEQAAQGVGVLFSSHQLDLVEKLCDRVCILDKGHVVASGSISELKRENQSRWNFCFSRSAESFAAEAELVEGVSVQLNQENRREVLVSLDHGDGDIPPNVLAAAWRLGSLRGIEPVQRSLEELLNEKYISAGRGKARETAENLETAGV